MNDCDFSVILFVLSMVNSSCSVLIHCCVITFLLTEAIPYIAHVTPIIMHIDLKKLNVFGSFIVPSHNVGSLCFNKGYNATESVIM